MGERWVEIHPGVGVPLDACIASPTVRWNHVDGPLLCWAGHLHWLTLRERFSLFTGFSTIEEIAEKHWPLRKQFKCPPTKQATPMTTEQHGSKTEGRGDWKLVPIEPTKDMLRAGQVWSHPGNVWEKMLAAAPSPPSEPGRGDDLARQERMGDCPGYTECEALGKTSCPDCRPSDLPAREAIERAARYAIEAIDSGRSEPLYIARDALKNALEDAAALLSQGNGEAVGRSDEEMERAIEQSEVEFFKELRRRGAASPSQPEGVREALEAIERGITAVRLDAALKEQPISPDVFEQFHKDILAAIKLTTTPSHGLVEAAEWQPMETAPKDTLILVCWGEHGGPPIISRWLPRAQRWTHPFSVEPNPPTHWMPLPAPPRTLSAKPTAND